MGIPQFHNEGPDQNGGSASLTVSFAGFTWSANDIIEIIISTDGWVPVLATANGFALAQDPNGNTASSTTNGGVAGAADCGIAVFWKRAVGSTTTTDPVPTFQAPSVQSGTSWAMQVNSFSGARTTGTPYHAITSGIVTTATTAVTSVAATSTLANCLFMPRVASAEDDQAFNNWTMTGSAGPSGTGAPNTGWHSNNGNACAFTGDEGGFASATANVTATTTFATSTKQAKVTLVMASLNEAFGPDDDPGVVQRQPLSAPATTPAASPQLDDLPPQSSSLPGEDTLLTSSMFALPLVAALFAAPMVGDELPTPSSSTIIDEDAASILPLSFAPQPLAAWVLTDELPVATTGIVDEDGLPPQPPGWAVPLLQLPTSGDELPGGTLGTGLDEDATSLALFTPLPGPSPGPPVRLSSDEIVAQPASLSIGVTTWREKANTTSPNSGTLTTLTVNPAWTGSTSYQIINDTRVANSGNSYEIVTSGTSASSGGPTGTPAPVTNGAITDGSAKWNYLAAGNGATDTQTSGSLFLVSSGQGNDAASGTTPTDNKSNSYSIIGSKSLFAGFPQSSAASYVAALPSTGGTGHTISGTFGAGLDGGGDEKSLMFVEVIGGTKIQDHSQGEFSPNGSNVVTSNSVTTTQAAILVCFCWLNGTTHSDGFLHTATPGSGFTALPLASGLLEIANGAGQVQGCTIYKQVSSAGTYTASITTGAGLSEGSVMHLIAVQGADVTVGLDDDPAPRFQLQPTLPLLTVLQAADELPAIPDEDEPQLTQVPWPTQTALVQATQPDEIVSFIAPDEDPGAVLLRLSPLQVPPVPVGITDELAMLPVDEDAAILALLPVAPQPPSALTGPADDLAALSVDEDVGPLPVPLIGAPAAGAGLPASDDVPAAVVVAVDDDPGLNSIALAPIQPALGALPVVEEIPSTSATGLAEDLGAVAPTPPAQPLVFVVAPQADELPTPVAVTVVDDDVQPPQLLTVQSSAPLPLLVDAETPAIALDDDPAIVQLLQTPLLTLAYAVSADDLPPLTAIEDLGCSLTVAWTTQAAPLASPAVDDLPPLLVVEDTGWSIALAWPQSPAPTAQPPDDDLPIAPTPPAPLPDDDTPQLAVVWPIPPLPPMPIFSDELVQLGNHVHIPGTSPDPEVYDGPLASGLFYGSS